MSSKRQEILDFMLSVNRLDELYYSIAKNMGMNENEFVLLYALSDEENHTQREIYETWMIPKTTLNSSVKKLSVNGIIELIPTGHKEKIIHITPCGKEYAEEKFSWFFELEEKVFARTIGKHGGKITNTISDFNELLSKQFSDKLKERNMHK